MNQNNMRKVFISVIFIVVVLTAVTLVALSFVSTSKIAAEVRVSPWLLIALVEIPFASLLAIRGFQRAHQLDLPAWLNLGYYASFAIVTSVNVYGLSQSAALLGVLVGLAVSGVMLLMDQLLVWLIIHSHKPHQKSARELLKEAKEVTKLNETKELIKYMHWESDQPALSLIKKTRKDAEKRAKVMEAGVSEYIQQLLDEKKQPPQMVEAEPVAPVTTEKVETESTTEVIPMPQRLIGFHHEADSNNKSNRFKPNTAKQQEAIAVFNELTTKLGRKPQKDELMNQGLTDHYARFALKYSDQ